MLIALFFVFIACKPMPPEVPVDQISIPIEAKPAQPDFNELHSCENAFKEACKLLNRQFYFSYIQEKPTFTCSSANLKSLVICDEKEIVIYKGLDTFIYDY